MATINTNMSANIAANSMGRNERSMSQTMERLSTGIRINSAKDDAAGLAISSKMTSQINGLNQAVRNANDAISMIQVAEGAMKEVTNMFQRMRELAVQAISDSNTSSDRTALNNEYKQLSAEVQRVAENTQWNGTNILDDTIGTSGSATFQIGANASQTVAVDFGNLGSNTASGAVTTTTNAAPAAATNVITITGAVADGDIISYKIDATNFGTITLDSTDAAAIIAGTTGEALTISTQAKGTGGSTNANVTVAITGANEITITSAEGNGVAQAVSDVSVSRGHHAPVAATDITTRTQADSALSVLSTAIDNVNTTRAGLGASMSRLEYAADNLTNVAQNSAAARSRIMDADYAAETTELARTQIIQQAGTAMLAQANQSQQAVLALLR